MLYRFGYEPVFSYGRTRRFGSRRRFSRARKTSRNSKKVLTMIVKDPVEGLVSIQGTVVRLPRNVLDDLHDATGEVMRVNKKIKILDPAAGVFQVGREVVDVPFKVSKQILNAVPDKGLRRSKRKSKKRKSKKKKKSKKKYKKRRFGSRRRFSRRRFSRRR